MGGKDTRFVDEMIEIVRRVSCMDAGAGVL